MKNKKTEANISMIVSKTFSGLNMNALKYLMPFWMAPLTGVTIRCTFAAIVFWIIGFFAPKETSTRKEKIYLFLLGAIAIYGFMFFYLSGLSKTTPVSSSIFSSLQPIWVFVIAVLFFKEKITSIKLIGILTGLGGALLCISTQKSDDLASDALTGNILCLVSSIAYAIYLIISHRILKSVGIFTMLKYTFGGAAFTGIIVTGITGFDARVLSDPISWKPLSILLFVLIFPTVISYLLMPIGLKYLKTTLVAIYGYIILIVATIVSLALGQDRFSWTQLAAILLICCGVYFVEIAENKDDKPSDPENKNVLSQETGNVN
ncbi:DMT family transporter [Barnesiella propionica]|uniref:DMT family transporter n=1 Tax=Barnesiella propionica TaxID=2981781 RepID=UPI0011CB4952|nr:DMT family transporter [Barnesiella propionica]MCU6769400.1 DMT family transporter [Barnesiella propionica]